MQRRKGWQPHLSQPTDNAHLLICTHNPLPVQINSVHFMLITLWTSLCQMWFTSCDLRSNEVSWKSKQSVYALSKNGERWGQNDLWLQLICYVLQLKTESLVKRRNFVLFSTKELNKVLNTDVSTLYTSGAWSMHTYIQPILNVMSLCN